MAHDVQKDYGRGNNSVVDGWASLGNHGKHPSNCHRDLRKWGRSIGIHLEPAEVMTPVRNLKDHGTVQVPHSVLYPHEVFATIWEAGPAVFQHVFLGPAGKAGLREFWRKQEGEEWVRQHPGFTSYGARRGRAIPFGVHADKGQHIKKDKILTISWGGVMSVAPTVWSKLLFTVVPDETLIPQVTDERLYSVLVWSCHWLSIGRYPPTDHDGTPWPHGSRRAANAGKLLAGHGVHNARPPRGDHEKP